MKCLHMMMRHATFKIAHILQILFSICWRWAGLMQRLKWFQWFEANLWVFFLFRIWIFLALRVIFAVFLVWVFLFFFSFWLSRFSLWLPWKKFVIFIFHFAEVSTSRTFRRKNSKKIGFYCAHLCYHDYYHVIIIGAVMIVIINDLGF